MPIRFPTHALALGTGLCGLLLASLISGCAERQVHYTYTKKQVSQQQLVQDLKVLRGTSGVEQVTSRQSSDGSVMLDLYLESDSTTKGMQTADDLGYQVVRN
jgi:hypothetical protein